MMVAISAEPFTELPQRLLGVVHVAALVAVLALPVNAPVNPVEVTEVRPAIVVAVPPKAILVLPMVTDELARLALDIEPANIALVTFPFPIVVALPTLVTSPVIFALVVTVAALPAIFVIVTFPLNA